MKISNKAQQIIEYLALFAVVTVVLISFIGPTGPFEHAVNRVLNLAIEIDDDIEPLGPLGGGSPGSGSGCIPNGCIASDCGTVDDGCGGTINCPCP